MDGNGGLNAIEPDFSTFTVAVTIAVRAVNCWPPAVTTTLVPVESMLVTGMPVRMGRPFASRAMNAPKPVGMKNESFCG